MPALGNQPCGKKEAIAARRTRVLELRVSGKSMGDIAATERIGRATVRKDLQECMAALAAEAHERADELRALQHERLEKVILGAFDIASTSANEETKLRALETVRRTVETIARLYGLNVEQAVVNVDQRSVTFIIKESSEATERDHRGNGAAETSGLPALASA